MKLFLSFAISLFFYSVAFGQAGTSIAYLDNFGSITLAYVGQVNGKASYSGTDGIATVAVSWTGSAWVITIDVGSGAIPSFQSNENTANNPPNFGIGNWQDIAADGTDLLGFSGNGTASTALPVEWLSFEARTDKRTVHLTWSTQSEIGNAKFMVERSESRTTFQPVGEVRGGGDGAERRVYAFTDAPTGSTTLYYRLKQVDHDGQFSYSEVISVVLDAPSSSWPVAYPNPSTGEAIFLDVPTDRARVTAISILDQRGRELLRREQSAGFSGTVRLETADLPKGVYVLRISTTDQTTGQLIIKH